MKKFFFAVAAFMFSLSAFAGDKTVTGVDGVKTLGTENLLAVRSVGSSAEALYPNGGWQAIADNALKQKAAELVAKCGPACVTVDGNYGITAVAVGRSNGITCGGVGSKSVIGLPGQGQPLEIEDGCAFWQKAK